MSDVGTITEIEPEDQLGWIELENGDRVRFGGTACKGFVPEVGMTVKVLGTRPGYGGTVKATGLEKIQAAAGAGPRAIAATAGAQPQAPRRQALQQMQNAGVRADELLLKTLGRWDMDDALHEDLEALHFEVAPQPASGVGCDNPWVHVVAMDGGGNAYGLYTHPMVAAYPQAPWVFWDHETLHVRYLAMDSAALFQGLLSAAEQEGGAAAGAVPRAKQTLTMLGVPDEPGALDGQAISWLPPEDSELRPLDEYLGESDGAEMERGLLAYVSRKGDARAKEALASLYQAWGWQAPGW